MDADKYFVMRRGEDVRPMWPLLGDVRDLHTTLRVPCLVDPRTHVHTAYITLSTASRTRRLCSRLRRFSEVGGFKTLVPHRRLSLRVLRVSSCTPLVWAMAPRDEVSPGPLKSGVDLPWCPQIIRVQASSPDTSCI